jgi:hypothetical protein
MKLLDLAGLQRFWGRVKPLIDARLAKTDVVNNVTTSTAGKALDASRGKALNDILTGIRFTTGENTNGKYIRFENGLIFMWGAKVINNVAVNHNAVNLFNSAFQKIDLPIASLTEVVITSFNWVSASGAQAAVGNDNFKTAIGGWLYNPTNVTTSGKLHWSAWGTWK